MSLNTMATDRYAARQSFDDGDVIMRQGETGDRAFLIEQGQVEIVVTNPQGEETVIGQRGPGSIIGEMAMIDHAPRTATVRSKGGSLVQAISQEDFESRLKKADPIVETITKVVMTRYRDLLRRSQGLTAGDYDDDPSIEDQEKQIAGTSSLIETVEMTNAFRDAIANDELQLYYQPIVDLRTGQITALEALMRWIHPEKGFIPPDTFIPVAESSGLIVEATRWAMDRACKDLVFMEQEAPSPEGGPKRLMSVNFSSLDFMQPDFLHSVQVALERYQLEPQQLQIEITERLLIENAEDAIMALAECQEKGISIAIDDFGTGYSSLNYLHRFPINTLKIDRSFIMNLERERRSVSLVKSIISLGQNLNMKIVAEGVEKPEQARILLDNDCDAVQGYYFAKPAPLDEVVALMREWQKPDY